MKTWKSVEEEFESWWWRKDSFCFQFHDTRAANGAAKAKGFTSKVITTSHPSDFLVTHLGTMFYAEVKSSTNATSFPFSNIEPSQWSAARQQVAAGGNYFFFLFSQRNNQWYKLDASFLLEIKEQGRSSVKWAELTDYPWTPPQ